MRKIQRQKLTQDCLMQNRINKDLVWDDYRDTQILFPSGLYSSYVANILKGNCLNRETTRDYNSPHSSVFSKFSASIMSPRNVKKY